MQQKNLYYIILNQNNQTIVFNQIINRAKAFELIPVQFYNIFYTIDETNDMFYIGRNGAIQSTTLYQCSYTAFHLQTKLITKIQNIEVDDVKFFPNVTVTYNKHTSKYVFSDTGSELFTLPIKSKDSTLWDVLGFRGDNDLISQEGE